MKSHHNGHVERSNTNWKDLGVNQIGCAEPTNRPSYCVEEDGNDSTSRRMLGRRVTFDICSAHAVCRSKIGTNVTKSDNLETDTSNERSSTSDKIDNEQGKKQNNDKLDETINSSGEKGLFRACDTKLLDC